MSPKKLSGPISPLESATIRAAIAAIIVNVASMLTWITGQVYDVAFIKDAIDTGLLILFNVATLYYALKAIQARINATSTIKRKRK